MLATPTQTPQKRCKSCGQDGHVRSSSRKCPNYCHPQKKARLQQPEETTEPAESAEEPAEPTEQAVESVDEEPVEPEEEQEPVE